MIKNQLSVIFLFLITSFLSFSIRAQTILSSPKQVKIAGKIRHYNPEHSFNITVNRLGLPNENAAVKIDSAGNFYATFETYVPTDTWVTYKSNFLVLTDPGDSLYVEFDGQSNGRPEILKTIKYGGNNAESNRYASLYQQMYYSDPVYTDWKKNEKTVKEYETEEYLRYLDTLQSHIDRLYKTFITKYDPDNKSRKWAAFFGDQKYYDCLAFYPWDHRTANNMGLSSAWDVPKGFFQKFANRLPIEPSMLASSFSLRSFIWQFSNYVTDQLKGNEPEGVFINGGRLFRPTKIADSLAIYSTLKYVPDTLLRQFMLTDYFSKELEQQRISGYEKFEKEIKQYVNLPFLQEPLHSLYLETKMRIETPKLYTEALLKEAGSSSIVQLLDSILLDNKNKVIYIDVWATWCSPCLAEFPNSKQLEQQMQARNAAFIYLCTDSKEDQWKATLAKHQLGGQHYFLTRKQSAELAKTFGIKGIPFYILIDKNGVIREQGSQLRPQQAKKKIEDLL